MYLPKLTVGLRVINVFIFSYGMLSSLSFLEENLHIDFLVLLPLSVE